jgi:DNA-binding response OmpR family regulator
VVVIAGAGQLGAVDRSLSLGAEDCLVRPCEPTVLRTRVAACLEKRLREREAAYLQMMRRVADALATAGTEPLDPSRLARPTDRMDPFGDLARAFQQMASELDRVRRQTTDSDRAGQ